MKCSYDNLEGLGNMGFLSQVVTKKILKDFSNTSTTISVKITFLIPKYFSYVVSVKCSRYQ